MEFNEDMIWGTLEFMNDNQILFLTKEFGRDYIYKGIEYHAIIKIDLEKRIKG